MIILSLYFLLLKHYSKFKISSSAQLQKSVHFLPRLPSNLKNCSILFSSSSIDFFIRSNSSSTSSAIKSVINSIMEFSIDDRVKISSYKQMLKNGIDCYDETHLVDFGLDGSGRFRHDLRVKSKVAGKSQRHC